MMLGVSLDSYLMCGVKTNIVTAVEIHGEHAADTKMLPALTDATAMNFTVNEVSADKGYASKANYESVARFGTVPLIVIATLRIRVRDLEERDRELGERLERACGQPRQVSQLIVSGMIRCDTGIRTCNSHLHSALAAACAMLRL